MTYRLQSLNHRLQTGVAAPGLIGRLVGLPDRLLFGPDSQLPGLGGQLRRVARYPYALIRDLLGGKLNLHAMGLVYTTLLALIPLVAFSFGILKAFNSQSVLQPLVHEFFQPMGAAADQFTARVMEFANKVRGGIVGSVGLALLIWTLIGTMKKVEDGFNFVWHVDVARSFTRRLTEYVALLIMGPVLIAAVIGLSRAAANSVPLRLLSSLPLLDRTGTLALNLAPFVIVSGLLTALYIVIPNTPVQWRPALAGGITAGILWATVGRIFTVFVLASTRLTVVYAGFAIMISALLWTYLGWIILLLGAQVSFYVQNPSYLRLGLREPHLSCSDIERLSLSVMYLIGAQHRSGGDRLTVARLAAMLGYPGIAVARSCRALEAAGLLVTVEDESLLPGRDISQLRVVDIIAIARAQSSGVLHTETVSPAAINALCVQLEQGWRQSCGELSLSDLLPPPG